MKALLFPIILAIFAAGGVIAADTIRGDAPAAAPIEGGHGADGDGHGGEASHDGDASGEHGDESGGRTEDTDFINFKRQFVVPVLKDNAVEALILINLGLEVPAAERDNMFRLEPRFRDAFIRELLQLSDDGYFDQELTSTETYEVLRETLSRAANDISDGGIKDILILDLSRQDR